MFLRQAAGLLRRIRLPSRAVSACCKSSSTIVPATHFSSNAKFLNHWGAGFSTWSKHHRGLALWIVLYGQAAIILGVNDGILALAEEDSASELGTRSETGEAYATGLQRVEDGSVISNSHTSKWRIFTDNGRDLFLKGKLDEAETYFLSALKEAKDGFGERDPHVASSCNNLAELYRVRKAFEKADPLYLEAVNILEESFGPEDIRVGAAFHNLGQFYLVQRKLEQARVCYERALKIKGRVLGHSHTDYADTMFHLGTVLHLQGKDKDSKALIQESIRILEDGGLGESMTCIRRLRYLAQMFLKSNRLPDAENLQRKILHVLELSKGWRSLDTVIAAEGLALTLQSVGSLAEAQELLERCLDVRKTLLREDHIQVGANMLLLARVAMLNSNRIRKMNISEASSELDKAKILLDGSIRIARRVLDSLEESRSNVQNNGKHRETEKDEHTALVILLQSLDALGLLEIIKYELIESQEPDANLIDAERALCRCISIFKELGSQSSLSNYSDVKAEYLSCLKHLMSLLNGSARNKIQQPTITLQEVKDEISQLEADLSPIRKRRN